MWDQPKQYITSWIGDLFILINVINTFVWLICFGQVNDPKNRRDCSLIIDLHVYELIYKRKQV